MLRFLLIVLACSFLACEPECECEVDTEIDSVVADLLKATGAGEIVKIGEVDEVADGGISRFSALPVATNKLALTTCPALGLSSPEFDWFCEMTHPNGHAIAKDSGSPTLDDFSVYEESPSDEYPTDMTFRIFFSQKPEHYPNHATGPVAALRGLVTAWGAGWNTAREARCNSPVWAPYCAAE
jgi:hypothetical protein